MRRHPIVSLAVLLSLIACSAQERVVRDETHITVRATAPETRGGVRVARAPEGAIHELPDIGRAREVALGENGERCALLDDGSVWCWDADARDRVPSRIEGLDPVTHLYGGQGAFCGVGEGGRVSCWGAIGVGGSRWSRPDVLAIPPPSAMAFGVSGGCAIVEDGTVRCWGTAWNGHTSLPLSSIETIPRLAGVIALDAYDLSRCALTRAHEILCWGWERFHHMGERRDDGLYEHRAIRDAIDVALTRENLWWVTRDGHVRGMIRGPEDRRRSGSHRYDAVDVRGIEDAVAIESAGATLCAFTREGALWCFEAGTREARVQPVTNVRALVSTERSGAICAGTTEGGWHCKERDGSWAPLAWGPRVEAPPSVSAAGPVCGYGPDRVPVEALSAGYGHFCVRLGDGAVRCWGLNQSGQTGGPMAGDPVSSRAPGVPRPATTIATGLHFSCAITDDASLWCWGQGGHGQLGRGDRRNSSTPMQVALRGRVEAIATGRMHACARTQGAQVWCWGANDHGQLGDGTSELRTTPVRVRGLGAASAIAAGPDATCAVDRGNVACWGGATASAPPHAIEGVDGSAVRSLAVAQGAACALLNDGSVSCWGSGAEGQLGAAQSVESARAVRIEGIPPARTIAAYEAEICISGDDGSAWCWGRASSRRGASSSRRAASEPPPGVPRRIEWLDQVIAIAPGYHEVCAAQQTGGVCCWDAGAPRPVTW
ncbi:RCC1 domain-containing protein [Sandaracinus amylolyticus]|uniref:RCC1 domain-containing protein n=1 Tax=Sandaracinus amylolyticus TaxID=927083 RepID=UPI001F31ACEE|nr:hypothetical protein [Sandaracinus amylolyticus]UJR83393.1 Hypothetical protein I5071_54610 [Sandaracinus amylolyticus]